MAPHGKDFAVDLYELDIAAKDDLPTVADIYQDAIGKLNRVADGLSNAMRRPAHFGGDTLGPVHQSYVGLQKASEKLLKETRRNLDDTAKELGETVKLYAKADNEANQEFQKLLSRRGKPHPE